MKERRGCCSLDSLFVCESAGLIQIGYRAAGRLHPINKTTFTLSVAACLLNALIFNSLRHHVRPWRLRKPPLPHREPADPRKHLELPAIGPLQRFVDAPNHALQQAVLAQDARVGDGHPDLEAAVARAEALLPAADELLDGDVWR